MRPLLFCWNWKVKEMSILQIEELAHSFGEKRLFQGAALRLLPGDHMGLTGPNGSGKSTLIRIAAGQLLPEQGKIEWQPRARVGYLDQYASIDQTLTILDYLRTAYRALFDAEAELARTHEAMAAAEGDALTRLIARADRLQQALEQGGFYSIDSHIARVAAGLGVAALGLTRPVGELSGGQRAKVLQEVRAEIGEAASVQLFSASDKLGVEEGRAWMADVLQLN